MAEKGPPGAPANRRARADLQRCEQKGKKKRRVWPYVRAEPAEPELESGLQMYVRGSYSSAQLNN